MYLRRFGVVKKVVTKSHHFNHNHQIDSGLRRIILLLNEDVETRQRPTASGGNIFSKDRIFTAADAIVNVLSMKVSRLNREMRSSNLQQNKTKARNNRISLKLTQGCIRMYKPLPKETRWSKTMLHRDSQSHRKMVLRQCRETEANWRVIIRLPAIKLSDIQTQW